MFDNIELMAYHMSAILVGTDDKAGHKTRVGPANLTPQPTSSTPCRVFQMGPETHEGSGLRTLLENVLFLKKGFVLFSF